MILSSAAVSLERSGSDIELETFILDFEDVFEKYLRRVLEMHSSDDVIVRDGNEDGARPLYDGKSEPKAQPDIVVEHLGGPPLIVEVKYKDKPDRADINQVVTYAVCYRTESAVLVHQVKGRAHRGLTLRGAVNGIRVYTYAFDLAAADLTAEEHAFAKAMGDLALQVTIDKIAA